MSATTAAPSRRVVRYVTLAEFMEDVERLGASNHRTLGNWSYGQILDHLARAMTCAIDGFGFKAPWIARAVIAPMIKNSVITKEMKPGFKLPRRADALLPANEVSLEAGLESLRKAIHRFERETTRHPHPFLGNLASQEWVSLTLRHAELHMSFVLPDCAD